MDTHMMEVKDHHEHDVMDGKVFRPSAQTWKLFKEQVFRLMITLVTIALFIATLKAFEHDGNVSHYYKILFNAVITALSLILGLNFLEVFKDLAKMLRWRVLANRAYTVREVDLILGGESLQKLMTLMWESPRRPMILAVCTIWIALNLAAQVSVAVIGLTYSMDGGSDSNGTYVIPHGNVRAAQLDCYHDGKHCPPYPESDMVIAHNYGDFARGRTACPYSNDSEIASSSQLCDYFNNRNGVEFAYRFSEYNPNDTASAYPYLTNRTIRASTGVCHHYNISSDPLTFASTPDGQNEVAVYQISNSTWNATLPIPRPYLADDSTTYVYNGSLTPQNATLASCGPRCITVYALQHKGIRSNRRTTVYSCPISVSEVLNSTLPYHAIQDDVARLAASSIALTGRYTNPNSGPAVWMQYQLYLWGSYWETQGLDAQGVGARMAEFAIGSLLGMDTLNPRATQPGNLPILGYRLTVQWPGFIAIVAAIAAAHALLVALMLWLTRPIVVLDDSSFCIARLLNGLVAPLSHRGSLCDRKEMASLLGSGKAASTSTDGQSGSEGGDAEKTEKKVVYGVRYDSGQVPLIDMAEDIPVRRQMHQRRFPTGLYL